MTQPPLSFVENRGQVESAVRFYVRQGPATVFFTPGEVVMSLSDRKGAGHAVRVQLLGADPDASIRSLESAPGLVSVFQGSDSSAWLTGIPTHNGIAYVSPWPGVDVQYWGREGRLESVYLVRPGADPGAIKLRYSGQDELVIDGQGRLAVRTPLGEIVEGAPTVYQEAGGRRSNVGGRYVLLDERTVGFQLGAYDRRLPLVIDPTLMYSTYLGGSGSDQGNGIAVDSSGNAYVAGLTTSTNFPAVAGSYRTTNGGGRDAFVTKLGPSGALVYSTYLGGSGLDEANGIDIDASGNAYITGVTASTNFPTLGAYQTLAGGGDDVFVTKLNASGSGLVYSTYLGGTDDDESLAIAVDGPGSAYVTGATFSSNFDTLNAFQIALVDFDAFVTKLSASGSTLAYSTYLGGTGLDEGFAIAVDGSGSAYVTGSTFATDFPTASPYRAASGGGRDGFVTKLSTGGAALTYSTYLGGSGSDYGAGIAVDGSGNAYVAGLSASSNFPTFGAIQGANAGGDDAFVTKLNAAGSAPLYSTYLGGSGGDGAGAIALDSDNGAFVTGSTFSTNFPTVSPIQGAAGGGSDAFVAKVSSAGSSLAHSTYLGGTTGGDRGWGIAAGAAGHAYVVGSTFSSNFPLASPSQSANAGLGDAFVARINTSSASGGVGGIAELAGVRATSLRDGGSSGRDAALRVAGVVASAVAATALGGAALLLPTRRRRG